MKFNKTLINGRTVYVDGTGRIVAKVVPADFTEVTYNLEVCGEHQGEYVSAPLAEAAAEKCLTALSS